MDITDKSVIRRMGLERLGTIVQDDVIDLHQTPECKEAYPDGVVPQGEKITTVEYYMEGEQQMYRKWIATVAETFPDHPYRVRIG